MEDCGKDAVIVMKQLLNRGKKKYKSAPAALITSDKDR